MSKALTTRLLSRDPLGPEVVDMRFDLVEPRRIAFQAGQFVTLSVGHDDAGRDVRRSYSIASPSDEGERLRFLVRLVEGGPATRYFAGLALGDEVAMTGPHGFFTLLPRHAGDVVFAATGTGIAPVFPMLRELGRRAEPGRRLLYWGLRSERDLFATEEVAAASSAARADLRTYLSRPSPAWTGASGRITSAVLDELPRLEQPTFYIVGNGAMIEELRRELVARGVDRKRQIRTESFFD
jgi:ferredoxin-NADP reductase